MTPQELAKAYVDTIMGPLNGWGQCVHPTLGRSDFILLRLQREVGNDVAASILNAEIANWRIAHGQT